MWQINVASGIFCIFFSNSSVSSGTFNPLTHSSHSAMAGNFSANLSHVFSHPISIYRYRQHSVIENCLKITGIAALPTWNFNAFKLFSH